MSVLSQRALHFAVVIPLVASVLVMGGTSEPASAAVSKASSAICSKITKAQAQILLSDPITAEKVASDRVPLIGGSIKGQRCTFSTEGTSAALTVIVLKGSANNANAVLKGDLVSFDGSSKVPGIGTKAIRQTGSADQVSSLKGNVYCSVSMSDNGDMPGIAQRMAAAGDTSDIGDRVYAAIALAMGTLCNRVYGSGNVTPNLSFPPSPPTTTTTIPTGITP